MLADVRAGPDAHRQRRHLQAGSGAEGPLLCVRRLHHGRARVPHPEGDHQGPRRHERSGCRDLHAASASECNLHFTLFSHLIIICIVCVWHLSL